MSAWVMQLGNIAALLGKTAQTRKTQTQRQTDAQAAFLSQSQICILMCTNAAQVKQCVLYTPQPSACQVAANISWFESAVFCMPGN